MDGGGCDTFIHDVMRHWGIANAISPGAEGRYPTLGEGPEAGAAAASVASPLRALPFQNATSRSPRTRSSHARFMLVDGEAFSCYGTRMLHVADHLSRSPIGWRLRRRIDVAAAPRCHVPRFF